MSDKTRYLQAFLNQELPAPDNSSNFWYQDGPFLEHPNYYIEFKIQSDIYPQLFRAAYVLRLSTNGNEPLIRQLQKLEGLQERFDAFCRLQDDPYLLKLNTMFPEGAWVAEKNPTFTLYTNLSYQMRFYHWYNGNTFCCTGEYYTGNDRDSIETAYQAFINKVIKA